jgi:hypothetical protein
METTLTLPAARRHTSVTCSSQLCQSVSVDAAKASQGLRVYKSKRSVSRIRTFYFNSYLQRKIDKQLNPLKPEKETAKGERSLETGTGRY